MSAGRDTPHFQTLDSRRSAAFESLNRTHRSSSNVVAFKANHIKSVSHTQPQLEEKKWPLALSALFAIGVSVVLWTIIGFAIKGLFF